MGTILAPLNSTMIALALPVVRTEFDVSHAAVAWLAMTYLIAMVVMQPLGGRLGDQLGRVRVFQIGLVLFLLLSFAAAAAPSFSILVLFRTMQAVIGAAIIPCGVAILRESVPPSSLGRVTGIISSASSITAALSPMLGAGILAFASWRIIFLANIPFIAVGLAGLFILRYQEPERQKGKLGIDLTGTLAFAAMLALVTLIANSLRNNTEWPVLAALFAGLAGSAGLLLRSQRLTAQPMAEWSLFRNRSFTGAGLHVFCNNLVMYTITLMVPFYIKELRGGTSLTAGALLLAMSAMMAVGAPIGGRVSDSLGRSPPVVVGGVLMTVPIAILLAILEVDTSLLLIAVLFCVAGLGLGLGLGAAPAAAIETAPTALSGAAAGTNFMMRWLGAVIGIAALGGVLNSSADAVPELSSFTLIVAMMLVASVVAGLSGLLIQSGAASDARVRIVTADGVVRGSDEAVR